MIPEVSVKSLAVVGREQIAVGSADGYPAIWRKSAAGSWTLVSSLAQVSAEPRLAALTSVTTDGDDWLAVGVPGPVAFTSENGTTWRPAPGIARDLASVTGVAAAAGPGGYVIVGKVVAPGGGCIADVWWSSEDGGWVRAHDVNDTAGSSQQVAAQGHRVVVLGQQTTAGVTTPLAELSTDGGATFKPVPFAVPGPDTSITALAPAGTEVTAIGSGATAHRQQPVVLTLPAR